MLYLLMGGAPETFLNLPPPAEPGHRRIRSRCRRRPLNQPSFRFADRIHRKWPMQSHQKLIQCVWHVKATDLKKFPAFFVGSSLARGHRLGFEGKFFFKKCSDVTCSVGRPRLGLLNLGMPHSLRGSFTSTLALLLCQCTESELTQHNLSELDPCPPCPSRANPCDRIPIAHRQILTGFGSHPNAI